MKKYLLIVFCFAIGLFLTSKAVQAAFTPGNNSTGGYTTGATQGASELRRYYDAVGEAQQNGEMSLPTWIGGIPNQALGVLPSIIASGVQQMGYDPTQTSSPTGYLPSGVLGGLASAIDAMYQTPPASSAQYFADIGKNFGLAQPTYAQTTGFGFNAMTGLLNIWKIFRDIAYVLFTIIFVIIGLAIMFRVKINPQTVVSIQTAIPQLVIGLILVTFSYAIAGLVIDLMYVVFGVAISLLEPGSMDLLNAGFDDAIKGVLAAPGAIGWATMVGVGAAIGSLVWFFGGAVIGGAVFVLVILVILAVILFKLLFALLKSYITILFLVILAPIHITLGIIPGSPLNFGSWLKNLVANVLVFPAVGIFLLLIKMISTSMSAGEVWVPPYTGFTLTTVAAGTIGLGMMLMIPSIPQMVLNAFGIKEQGGYGAAIGGIIAPVQKYGLGPLQKKAMVEEEKYKAAGGWGATVATTKSKGRFDILRGLGVIK